MTASCLFAAVLCFVATDARKSSATDARKSRNQFELFAKCPESAFPMLAEVYKEHVNEPYKIAFAANATWAKLYIAENPKLYPGINASAAANVSSVSFVPKNYILRLTLPKHNSADHPHESTLFLFGALALGCATLYALSRASGPFRFLSYEPVLLVEGILLSVLDRQSGHGLGALSRSLASWQAIDAHMILYGFLPALLFGDAMHLNTHTFTRCAAQCVILAVPGVVIGTALTAASTHWIGLEWSWPLLFAFGAIASATDPVAVVSLLKNLGASRVLTMQITGESLLNDGTAIVIFTVCYDGVKHPLKTFSVGGVASTLARMALGGPLLGWCAGQLLLAAIRAADQKTKHDDALLQLMLTIAVAYLTFFAAEAEFHVSGVLATVVAGFVVAKHAGPALVSVGALATRY